MGSSTRTLVVSPDPGLVQQVRTALDAHGVKLTSASTAARAIAVATEKEHALIIAAAELPDGSGYELSVALKVFDPPPVVLLVGGDRDGKAIARSHRAGADGFLHRPIRAAELIGRLRDLMGTAWFEGGGESSSDVMAAFTGANATSMVDPRTGVFPPEESGYSVSVMDDSVGGGDGNSLGQAGNTEELPALAIEQFDEEHHVSVPVSADVTAHGLSPVQDRPETVTPPEGTEPVVALGPQTGKTPPVRIPHAVATEASVDARFAELMAPGGALSLRIEGAVTTAVNKALAEALPAIVAVLDAREE
jgi:CheY-like chemotaxis protein